MFLKACKRQLIAPHLFLEACSGLAPEAGKTSPSATREGCRRQRLVVNGWLVARHPSPGHMHECTLFLRAAAASPHLAQAPKRGTLGRRTAIDGLSSLGRSAKAGCGGETR